MPCIVSASSPLLVDKDTKKMGPRPPPGRSSTSKSGARWSLPITFFLLFTAAQQSQPLDTAAGPPSTGRILIVGGLKAWGSLSLPYSDALFGLALPSLPDAVFGNTLSRAGSSVYSCGGFDTSENIIKNCWVIDSGTEGADWRSFDIPWALAQHSAVVVQDEIWFFKDSKLRILNIRKPANEPREISLGFSFNALFCAVAHGSKIFLIGVGEGLNEVHVNSDHSKPQQWEIFSTLLQGGYGFGCHEFEGEVFVTGGYEWPTLSYLSSVEAISVLNGTVRSIGRLGGARRFHQMAIIAGRPAVLGGYNGITNVMETIETYDKTNNSWETLGRTLDEPRFFFGLTQFLR